MPAAHITRDNVSAMSTRQLVLLLAWLVAELASRNSLQPAEYDAVSMDVSEPTPGTPPASSAGPARPVDVSEPEPTPGTPPA